MEYFDVGADAHFLHCVLSRVVDIRPFCENRSQRYSIYLLNVVNRVLQYGQRATDAVSVLEEGVRKVISG